MLTRLLLVAVLALQSPVGAFADVDQAARGLASQALARVAAMQPVGSYALLRIGVPAATISVTVNGCSTSGDGGAGHFILDPTDTTTLDNAATVIVEPLSGKRWKRVFYGPVSVMWACPKANGTTITDGVMTSGSAVLTSSTAVWSTVDVGKVIIVRGAAAKATATYGSYTLQDLSTTIASVQSAGQVTLALPNASGADIAGAKVYYGTNDTAILNSVFALGRDAYVPGLPNGRFYMTKTRLFPQGSVRGDGRASAILTAGTSSESSVLVGNNLSNFEVSGLWLRPGNNNTSGLHGNAFYCTNCAHGHVHDVEISEHRRAGIQFQNASDIEIDHNFIHDSVVDATTEDFSWAGYDISMIDGIVRTHTHDNIIKNGAGVGVAYQIISGGGFIQTDNNVHDNIIDGESEYGIMSYKHAYPDDTMTDFRVHHNVVKNVTGQMPANLGNVYGACIYVQGMENGLVDSNYMENCVGGTQTVTVQLAPACIGVTNTGGIKVTNNVCNGSRYWGIALLDPSAQGSATGTAEASGNTILNTAQAGLLCRDRDRCNLTNNTINTSASQCILVTRQSRPTLTPANIAANGNKVLNCAGSMIEVNFALSPQLNNNQGDTNTGTAYGLVSQNSVNPQMVGNTLRNTGLGAIYVQSGVTGGGLVSSNIAYGKGSTSTYCYRIDANVQFTNNIGFSCQTPYFGAYTANRALAANVVTFDASYGKDVTYLTGNTGSTTLTTITGAQDGQEFDILVADAFTTIGYASPTTDGIVGGGGVSYAASAGDLFRCKYSLAARRSYCAKPAH